MSAENIMTPSLSARTERRRNLISLTPLIDVVFILLVFFMLASSFLDWRAIDLSPPVKAGGGAMIDGVLLVDVGTDSLRLSGEAMELEALADRVGSQVSARPDRTVIIRPGAEVTLQRTILVLDRLRAAGVQDMSLVRGRDSR
jgi:biopolymer transport protein ExbD